MSVTLSEVAESLAERLRLPDAWRRETVTVDPYVCVEWTTGALRRRLCLATGKHAPDRVWWWVEFCVPELDAALNSSGGFRIRPPWPQVQALTSDGYPRPRRRSDIDVRLVRDVDDWAGRLLTFVEDEGDLGRVLLLDGRRERQGVVAYADPYTASGPHVQALVLARFLGLRELECLALEKLARRGDEVLVDPLSTVPATYREAVSASARRFADAPVDLADVVLPASALRSRTRARRVPAQRVTTLGPVSVTVPRGWAVTGGTTTPGEPPSAHLTSVTAVGWMEMSFARRGPGEASDVAAATVGELARSLTDEDVDVRESAGPDGATMAGAVVARSDPGDHGSAGEHRPGADQFWWVRVLVWPDMVARCVAVAPSTSGFIADAAALVASVRRNA